MHQKPNSLGNMQIKCTGTFEEASMAGTNHELPEVH